MVTFADRPTLVHNFTQNVDDIQGQLLLPKPMGRTSLIDAIFLAVDNMKKARYQRQALVIISDGGGNRSRYTERDVKSLIKEEDVLVYSIGVFDTSVRTMEELLGPELLAEISGLTGASSYTLDNPNNLPVIAQHIAIELRNQYILGYRPDSSRRDGKWRKIKVKLALPPKLPTLRVQARTRYYGPAVLKMNGHKRMCGECAGTGASPALRQHPNIFRDRIDLILRQPIPKGRHIVLAGSDHLRQVRN